jgi:thiol-disulfide isomerase/thioredoxin
MSFNSVNPRTLRATVLVISMIGFAAVADRAGAADTYDLTIRVLGRDGQPAVGMHVAVYEVLVSNKLVEKFNGDLPADGAIHLAGLRGGKSRPVHRIFAGPNDEQIDTFRYEGPDAPDVMDVTLPLMAGDTAPEVSLVNVLTGERGRLSDYRGQVVYLDFWATWCVPCRQAMLRNEEAMKRRSADWAGEAVIMALSGDETPEVAAKFVRERGWTDVLQVWNDGTVGHGGATQAVLDFGIDDIPRAVLIGKDGTILWRGDPNKVDPEALIDERLN